MDSIGRPPRVLVRVGIGRDEYKRSVQLREQGQDRPRSITQPVTTDQVTEFCELKFVMKKRTNVKN